MNRQFTKTTLVILTLLVIFSTVQVCQAQNTSLTYQLLNKPEGNVTYELNVVVPQTLLQYYAEKRNDPRTSRDFPDFVTPYAVKPIADCMWQIYKNEEDFTNGVLMLVHQLTYEVTNPAMYPVETMVENKGDCDLFSFIAASILKAGGIDVVLLYYESQSHMNIGVHLASAPKDARSAVYYVTHDGAKYYIAECTGGNWKEGWRVGECPDDCKHASSQIITLENAEKVAPGQVSASFSALEPSTMSLEVSPIITLQNGAITFRGQIVPEAANKNVTFYAKINNSPWIVIGTTVTREDGTFEYIWTADTAGMCALQASWAGDSQHTGAISPTRSATVIPLFIGALVIVAVIAAIIGVIAVVISKHSHHFEEPELSAF
ncbi:MAG: Ig-like domain-containing protein [Candidatus Bathyarchaeota archaeon]|nr:Ig-like domain-containing protein [Candidatus Bathyarchaeota archaeon]